MLTAKEKSLLSALEPRAASEGVEIVTLEIVGSKKAPTIRVYIDAAGGISFDELARTQAWVGDVMDELDPFPGAYMLEVSSPGIGRDLVRPWHFERYLGEQIEVKLIRPMQLENGSSLREFVAPLCSCDDQTITVELDGQQLTIEKKDAAYIRLYEQISFK